MLPFYVLFVISTENSSQVTSTLSGGINCINWRNSIEFKFYGNQFHCARGLLFFFKCPFNSFVIPNHSTAAWLFPIIFNKVVQERLSKRDASCSQVGLVIWGLPRQQFLASFCVHSSRFPTISIFSFALNFPSFVSLATTFRMHSFYVASNNRLTIMNCWYFCDVFAFLT